MFEFLTVFLFLPALAAWVLMFPLGGAFLDGIRSARDPMHRVTPRSTWFFFDRAVAHRLIAWKWIWPGCYFLSLTVPYLMAMVRPDFRVEGSIISTLGLCVIYANIGLCTGLLIHASLLLLAPVVRELRWLMVASLAISLLVLAPILFAASIVFFRAFSGVPGEALRVFTFGFALFPLLVLILVMVLRSWARARGDHWFKIGKIGAEGPRPIASGRPEFLS